jgi:hypothetical protein
MGVEEARPGRGIPGFEERPDRIAPGRVVRNHRVRDEGAARREARGEHADVRRREEPVAGRTDLAQGARSVDPLPRDEPLRIRLRHEPQGRKPGWRERQGHGDRDRGPEASETQRAEHEQWGTDADDELERERHGPPGDDGEDHGGPEGQSQARRAHAPGHSDEP